MKRWLVVLLVVAALIILVSPGIVGRLAEKNLQDNLEWAEAESKDFLVTEETFRRGWFTAEGRHRIEVKDPELRSAILDLLDRRETDGDALALVIDTHVDHGIVPLTSMSRESGSLVPGLASTVSTFKLDAGDGGLVDLPGTLYSRVGLTGETTSRYLLEPGRLDADELDAEWGNADISLTMDPNRRRLRYDGELDALSFDSAGLRLATGAAKFNGDLARSRFGIRVGSVALDMGSLSLRRGSPLSQGGATGFAGLSLKASSEIEDDRINAKSMLELTGASAPGVERSDFQLELALSGMDARALQTILGAVRAGSGPGAAARTALYPRIEGDVQQLLAAGFQFDLHRLNLTLPEGDVSAGLLIDLPATADDGAFSWPSILLALSASADVRVAAALMETAFAANPEAATLVAMGIFRKEGEAYVMDAEYAKGLLTVNGAPMPIPLPSAPLSNPDRGVR